MSAVSAPTSSPSLLDRPAGGALQLIFTTLPAMLRLTCGLFGAVTALAVRTTPVRVPLLLAAVVVLTGWSVFYAARALWVGIGPGMVAGDVALTVAASLLAPLLVAPEVLPGEGSWLAVLASTTVINAQATAPVRWSVPAGLLVTAGYAVGTSAAGNTVEASAHAATLLVQTGCAAMMAAVMRRWISRADAAFTEFQRLRREAVLARTIREVERRQNRDLHDTVLSTLTMVGLGALPAAGSAALRRRAAADLRTLVGLANARSALSTGPVGVLAGPPPAAAGPEAAGGSSGATVGPSGVDAGLRAVLDTHPELRVTATLPPCSAPAGVTAALVDATAAALANVARHAPDAAVTVRLGREDGGVVVEVVDDGPGFDPATVPAHRYGLRESIRGRLADVGGRAEVTSAPGEGTRIRLEWPHVD
ncbi:ATP-binding protein [Micromonospora rifamycinica]|uniref:Histidine kinase-, DNA gyrase B-, and HSP90-like ATPase n=1 Tax=Micromonospora rifamycinica TaxID=291594 RepID=A0A109INM1_9ACTN|nr:ATP-binding protein [Micromonospora rifamycinica]KWV33849.1 histidine kinase [Micromonospora rifamycinica]SCG80210.1 Histidine kinase-, DNA gyrase B-, and HSP90-like ATPase [Micromonospora rifamycinica]